MTTSLTIAMSVAEASGDLLGAHLISAIKKRCPDARFIGIGGERMKAEGFESLYDQEKLAVRGFVEVVKRLPEILKIRKGLVNDLIRIKPDVFVGIDAPDFNLWVEEKLKKTGIPTVHYVSPSVWAWRQNRVHKIKRATDLVLAFLPFEKAFYDKFDTPCRFIGHTMADAIALKPNRTEACEKLGLDERKRYVAILIGSRGSEIQFLAEPFLKTAQLLKEKHPDLEFLVPMVNEKRQAQLEEIKANIAPELELHILQGQARQAMIAAECTLLASGTAALEAMLCKSPMVVGYKMKPLTYWLAKKLVKTEYISLPNLLANAPLVPEMIQEECNPDNLAWSLNHYLSDDMESLKQKNELKHHFTDLHKLIQCDADAQAAQAVVDVLEQK